MFWICSGYFLGMNVVHVAAEVDRRCESVGVENLTYGILESTIPGRSVLAFGHVGS